MKRRALSPLYAAAIVMMFFITTSSLLRAQTIDTAQTETSLIKIQKLTDKVILIGLGADAVTAIATQKGIVVIDAGISGTLTSLYRKIIEKECKRNDFAIVINTHGHHDHTYGNIAFTDATIIAHQNAVKEMNDRWSDTAKVRSGLLAIVKQYDEQLKGLTKGSSDWEEATAQRSRYNFAYEDAKNNVAVRVPDILFKDTLHKSMGDVTLNMIWIGKAHTDSDILIHIPELKMFFVGDLFFRYGRPSFEDLDKQDLSNYKKAIEWIESGCSVNDIFINGHGQIMKNADMDNFIKIVRTKIEALEYKLYYKTDTIK